MGTDYALGDSRFLLHGRIDGIGRRRTARLLIELALDRKSSVRHCLGFGRRQDARIDPFPDADGQNVSRSGETP